MSYGAEGSRGARLRQHNFDQVAVAVWPHRHFVVNGIDYQLGVRPPARRIRLRILSVLRPPVRRTGLNIQPVAQSALRQVCILQGECVAWTGRSCTRPKAPKANTVVMSTKQRCILSRALRDGRRIKPLKEAAVSRTLVCVAKSGVRLADLSKEVFPLLHIQNQSRSYAYAYGRGCAYKERGSCSPASATAREYFE